jgi:hypothetical protein
MKSGSQNRPQFTPRPPGSGRRAQEASPAAHTASCVAYNRPAPAARVAKLVDARDLRN